MLGKPELGTATPNFCLLPNLPGQPCLHFFVALSWVSVWQAGLLEMPPDLSSLYRPHHPQLREVKVCVKLLTELSTFLK